MNHTELFHLVSAIIVLFIVIGFRDFLELDPTGIGLAVFFAFVLIAVNVVGKKLMAYQLDASVHHSVIEFQRWGFKQHSHFKKPIPLGIILPLFISIVSLGVIKFMAVLTYNTTALRRRAAKRFGHMSYTEMTDRHHAYIGAAGVVFTLLSAIVFYFIPGLEPLARLSAFYAFTNMILFSKSDGMQIFMGSRFLWYSLSVITLVFFIYALLLGVF